MQFKTNLTMKILKEKTETNIKEAQKRINKMKYHIDAMAKHETNETINSSEFLYHNKELNKHLEWFHYI